MKKESTLKYSLIKKRSNNRLQGTLLILLQRRLLTKKLFGIFNTWEKKRIILYKPNLDINKSFTNDNWLILKKPFTNYSNESIHIKHVCANKRLLKKLIKY